MRLTDKDVEHVARLARLGLLTEEKKLYKEQLSRILEYARNIEKIDTTNVVPTYHPLPLENVFRKDEVRREFAGEKIVAGAPESAENMYAVPRILEES